MLAMAGSNYLQDDQTLVLDSDRIYGVREPEGFTPTNLTCPDDSRIVVTSVSFGYSDLSSIPLCGEVGPAGDPAECVVSLDSSHVVCHHHACTFPSLADWGAQDLPGDNCGAGLQYWHICFDCSGLDYVTAEMIDDDYAHAEVVNDQDYEEYGGGDDFYYYYYSDMYHPQVTNRFDVEGYEDIKCENGDFIKILSTKFGYDEQSLKSNDLNVPCVFDFTQQFSTKLCTDTECKSPTLKQLDLTHAVACSQSSGLGLWEIYYTCEKVGSIETEEKIQDMSHQLETHVGNVEANDLSTSVPSKSKEKMIEINDVTNISEDYDKAESDENLSEIISETATKTLDTEIYTTTFVPEEIINIDQADAVEATTLITEKQTIKTDNHVDDKKEMDEINLKSTELEETAKEENTGWNWSWNWGLSSVEDITEEEMHGVLRADLSNVKETNSKGQTDMESSVTEKDDDTDKIVKEIQGRYYPEEEYIEATSETMQHIFSDIYRADNLPEDRNNAINEEAYFVTETSSNQNLITTTKNNEEGTKTIINKNQILVVEYNTEEYENSQENKSQSDELDTSVEENTNKQLLDVVEKESIDTDSDGENVLVEANYYESTEPPTEGEKVLDENKNSVEKQDSSTMETIIFETTTIENDLVSVQRPMSRENEKTKEIDFNGEHSDIFVKNENTMKVKKPIILSGKESNNIESFQETHINKEITTDGLISANEVSDTEFKASHHVNEHLNQPETVDIDQDTFDSTNRQFLETEHMDDFSPQNATNSPRKNAISIIQLDESISTSTIYVEIDSDKIDRHIAKQKDEVTTFNIDIEHQSDIIDADRNDAEFDQESQIPIDPYLVEHQHADPRESEVTLEKEHQTPGTNVEKILENQKNPWQQTLSDQTSPGSLVTKIINPKTPTGTHKHQEIVFNENSANDKSQNILPEKGNEELKNSKSKENLVKSKANNYSEKDIKSKFSDKTVVNEYNNSLCEDTYCQNGKGDISAPSTNESYSDIIKLNANTNQNYGQENRSTADSTPSNMLNLTNNASVESQETNRDLEGAIYGEEDYALKNGEENMKTDYSGGENEEVYEIESINQRNNDYNQESDAAKFMQNDKDHKHQTGQDSIKSDDKLSTVNPLIAIKSDERKVLKTESINPHNVKNRTKHIVNNVSTQLEKANFTVNKIGENETDHENLKVSSFARENQTMTSSMNADLVGLQSNDDTSLDHTRNESLEIIESSSPLEPNLKVADSKDNNREEKAIIDETQNENSNLLVDKKPRREKLLIQKGFYKSTTKIPNILVATTTVSTSTKVLFTTMTQSSTTLSSSETIASTTTFPGFSINTTEKTFPASSIDSVEATTMESSKSLEGNVDLTEPNILTVDQRETMTRENNLIDEPTTTHNVIDLNTEEIKGENTEGGKNIEEAVTESTIEEEIEEEISHGIDQLKSELKMLLVFNHNVLNASNEIIKEATKAKVENFFESVSTSLNLLNFQKNVQNGDKTSRRTKQTESKKKEEINTATSILNITADISKTLASTVELGSKVDIKLPNISMTVMKKKMGTTNSNSSSSWEADTLKVNLPDQSTIAGADSSITVSFTSYDNLGSMMSMDDAFSSSVLSVNVLGVEKVGNTIPLTKPMEFILRHKPMKDFSERKCVYWDFEEIGWSQKGCYAVAEKSSENTTMCQCYHLTNFAVLVDVYGLAQSEQHKSNLDILTWIGCGISITSLTICIYVFSSFRSAKNDRSTINSNLCFCLLLAELFFLCGIGQTGYPSFCSVVAAVLHYLFLASFFWMLIAGFQIYVLLVEVFEPDGSRFVQYYLLGYIAPLLIVLCSLLMDTLLNYESVYGFRDFCWINSNIHLVLTFLMPVFLIVGANIYFLCVAVYKIHIHSKESLIVHKSRSASLKLYVKGLFGLLFLLGVTWGFGIISVTHPSLPFTYIFTILNSLHGFFIFIFNCVMNKKIRNEGRNKIEDALSCMVWNRRRHLVSRKESTLSNISASSATSNTNSTMVKEYFLPERMPYTIDQKCENKKKQNALSITYYY